jgi:hypothetical protein
MAFTLTLLGTDTVYVPEAQDYTLVRCINDKMPAPLQGKTIYISEFKEESFRYTLLNNEGKTESGMAYAKGKHPISNAGRSLGKVINALTGGILLGPKFTEIYIDTPFFKEEDLASYKPAALDIANGKGRAPKIEYPRGETLGFMSSKINQKNESVVTGANLTGNNVGTKIIEGLLKLLNAIDQDETELNIMAHSRGAVESIVIANILDRLYNLAKKSLENQTPFSYESLVNSLTEASGTKAALTTFVNADTSNKDTMNALLMRIQSKISGVNLNILNIDPVPGDHDNNILLGPVPLLESSLPGIAWFDSDFFNIPPIVKHYSLCVLENEHSRFFKPIIPKTHASTKFEFFTLPGHHGTASGSPYDQTQTKRPENPTGAKTYDVQNLMICKIADFLKSHGVAFKDGIESATTTQVVESPVSVPPSAPLSTGKTITGPIPFLDKILGEHLKQPELEKPKNLFNHYEKIYANWHEYKTYNYTAYISSLMLNNSIKNTLNPTAWLYGVDRQGNRLVHFHQHTDSSLSEHISAPSTRFINTEHALLYMKFKMSEYLWDSSDENPVRQLQSCVENLKKYSIMTQDTEPMRKRILELMEGKDDQGVSIFQNAFQMILSSIKNSYLQNTLSNEEQESVINSLSSLYLREIPSADDSTTLPPSLKNLRNTTPANTDTQAENWTIFIDELKLNMRDSLERALASKLEVFEMKLAQLFQTHTQPQQLEHDSESELKQAITVRQEKINFIADGIDLFLERLRDINDRLSQKNLTDEFPFSFFIELVDDFKERFNRTCAFLSKPNQQSMDRVASYEGQTQDGLTSTTSTPNTPPAHEQTPTCQDLNVDRIDLSQEILSRFTILNEENSQREQMLANFFESLTAAHQNKLKAQQDICVTEESNHREQMLAH